MRGRGFATALTFIGLTCLSSSAFAADETPKKKTADEEIEESKAALAESQAQTAPNLERGTPPYKPSIMPWILGGVGVAGMITGGVFVLISLGDKSKADDFESLAKIRNNPNEQNDLLAQAKKSDDKASTNMTIGLIAGGAGVLLLGVGIVWALVDGPPKPKEQARSRFMPFVGPGIAGGSLTYAF